MLKQINDLDSQIQALITDEKIFDAEIESAIEYSQKISMWNSKLSAQIKSYRNTTEENLKFHQALLTQETLNRSVENINEFESSNSNVRANYNIKLPKLSIEKYYGDPCVWLEFWNQFQNSIDKNESLSMIDKFSYLKSLLGGALRLML
ncbi:uncharacterized protein TNIN_283591 [Trichonephila inaurata madagascariensis]|uniref:Uncharacterized protein n=1 Tax=Trichonephila inaurata madagascariensis TaxID=2747483 RepID=A0A8X6YLC5_9ARAC|nr:uncharacterized protein TNIN_283591 [Trichonephila inaurata madagascariensis]